jgi:hypothetical protein
LVLFALTLLVGLSASVDASASQKTGPATIREPARPARYSVPRPYVRVRTSTQLRAALARRKPSRIVLRGGTYASDTAFVDTHGHSLYAGRLGKVVLTAGLDIGDDKSPSGGVVRGLVFDIRDPARTADGAAIKVSGDASGVQVLDTRLAGGNIVRSGIVVRQPEGFRAARLVVQGFTDYGVLVDANDRDLTSLSTPFQITDLDISAVKRSVPGSSDGRGEACVWIGNPGVVARVRTRDCGWTGLWTGTAATGVRASDIDIDATRTGVYLEHFTRDSRFDRIRVGRNVRVGLTAEWADPDWGRVPGSVDNVVEDSRFESWLAGVYLDQGTTRTTIRRSKFIGQRWAAIADYEGVENAYYGNDYRRIAQGALAVTHEHIRTSGG